MKFNSSWYKLDQMQTYISLWAMTDKEDVCVRAQEFIYLRFIRFILLKKYDTP